MEEISRRIGFIPFVYGDADASAIAQKTLELFKNKTINEIFVTSKYGIWKIFQDEGVPFEKLVVTSREGENEPMQELFAFLKKTNSGKLVSVHIIATHYCCPRFAAQICRLGKQYKQELDLMVGGCKPVYPKRDTGYCLGLLLEPFRILEDVFVS